MMDPIIKEKWVDALRSGQYKQGTMLLCSMEKHEVRHCCLGVLCEVIGVMEDKWIASMGSYNCDYYKKPRDSNYATILTHDLAHKLHIRYASDQLIEMNDGIGNYKDDKRSFAQIADWIEKSL